MSDLQRYNKEHPLLEQYRQKTRGGKVDFSLYRNQYIGHESTLIASNHQSLCICFIADVHSRLLQTLSEFLSFVNDHSNCTLLLNRFIIFVVKAIGLQLRENPVHHPPLIGPYCV